MYIFVSQMHPLGEENENEWEKRKLPKKTKHKKQTTSFFLQNWKCINKLKSASQKKEKNKSTLSVQNNTIFFTMASISEIESEIDAIHSIIQLL